MDAMKDKELCEAAPILYQDRYASMTHTCMCWGFECGNGWYTPLMDLSQKLEALNHLVKRYGVSIVAAQVKEKYGTLRFYYDIVYREPLIKRLLLFIPTRIREFVDRRLMSRSISPIQKNLLLKLKSLVISAYGFVNLYDYESDKSIRIKEAFGTLLTGIVDKYVSDAEKECEELCEECGCHMYIPKMKNAKEVDESDGQVKPIYEEVPDWAKDHQRIITKGWIRYICKNCSDKLEKELEDARKKYESESK